MPIYNHRKPHYAYLKDVADKIQSGWIAQYRGSSYISSLIQYGTGGVHSHSAMIRKSGRRKDLDILEVREWLGGRAVPLSGQVERYSGRIDVFSYDKRYKEYDGEKAADYMRELTDKKYGYSGVLRLSIQRTPILWRLWPLETDDLIATNQAPFCSHAVCASCRVGGGVDPVPRKPDYMTTPNDLTWSLLFDYEFTLVSERHKAISTKSIAKPFEMISVSAGYVVSNNS